MFNLLPIIVTLGGGYMLFKLRFFFFLHPIRAFKDLQLTLSKPECRRSLSLALAGTLGVGNIIGVAAGISLGGAGSIFWLLVSSVFASVLKFCEATLATDSRDKNGGGMMNVLGGSYKGVGKSLGKIYAVVCLLLAFVMGAALQATSISGGIEKLYGFNTIVIGGLLAFVALLMVRVGTERISILTSVIIPAATAVYVFLCFAVIISNLSSLPYVISRIIKEAFEIDSVRGGVFGFVCAEAIRQGYSRGLMSNEAGAGTSSLAHSVNDVHPVSAGMMGICEVIVDTVLLCPLSGIAILLSIDAPEQYTSGITLIMDSIGAIFGKVSALLIVCCIAAFAFSTVMCWYCYGMSCLRYLVRRGERLYTALFVVAVFFGCILDEGVLIGLSDSLLLVLTILTVSAIIKCSDRIKFLSEQKGLIQPRLKSRVKPPSRHRK